MALQSKSYSVGTGAWDATYVGFVLTLNITENSISQANNTSNISYELILSNPNNNYPYNVASATRYVELVLGSHTLSQNVTGSWIFDSSTKKKVLLSGSVDIKHADDGSSSIDVYAKMPRLRTDGAGPQEMVISDTMTLTSIQREYTNKVDPNGGYRVSDSNTSVITFTKKYGEIEIISERKRDGYALIGYTMTNSDNGSTTDIGGATLSFDNSTKTATFKQGSKPITLIAQWSIISHINFNGQTVTSIVFNGQPVNSLIYNGTKIF